MSQIYTVNDAMKIARTMGKGVPFTGVDMSIADLVNSVMYKAYPWRDTLKTSPDNWTEVALVDGSQDYATGLTDLFRMTQFWIRRTDVTPNEVRNISVSKNVTIDLIKKSPYAIRLASYQAGANKFRLETAVQVATGTTWKIGGEYQPHPTRLTDLEDTFWFQDEHLEVFAKGLTYWAYRLADDGRAGAAQRAEGVRTVYTGALAEFMDGINQMAAAEDFGNVDTYYPDEPLGVVDGRRYYSNDVYPII